jgi:hypothetical protein
MGQPVGREGLHHEGERGRHQQGGAETLRDPEQDQLQRCGGHRAGHGGQGEENDAGHEDTSSPEEIGDAP